MKQISLTIMLLCIHLSLEAQLVVHAGPQISNIRGVEGFSGGISPFLFRQQTPFLSNITNKTGFNLGVRHHLVKWKEFTQVDLGLNFSNQGFSYSNQADQNLYYLEVPVLLRVYSPNKNLSMAAGPQFSYLAASQMVIHSEVGQANYSHFGQLRRWDVAYTYSFTLHIRRVNLVVAREIGFLPLHQFSNSPYRNRVLRFGIETTLGKR